MLSLRFCARAFSSCGERGPLFIAVRGPLTIAASLVAEHRLQTRRLSSCGSRAQLLRGMWDLPRPGLEPVSPALAGRFSTTAPPEKPQDSFFYAMLSFSLKKKKKLLWLLHRSQLTDAITCVRKSPMVNVDPHCVLEVKGCLSDCNSLWGPGSFLSRWISSFFLSVFYYEYSSYLVAPTFST